MICSERLRLANDYCDATRRYSDAVRKMVDLLNLGLHSEVEVLRNACRSTWSTVERARLALSRHEADHFCDRTDFVPPAPAAAMLR